MNVKFPSTNFNMMYQGNYLKSNNNTGFKSSNEIIYEDDYVKIPKEKYQRDKILGNILGVMLFIEMAYAIYKLFKSKPPFP